MGPSAISVLLAVVALIAARVAADRSDRISGLIIAVAGAVSCSLIGRWLLRVGIFRLTWLRSESTNLVATKSDLPKVWLVAHIDSKSQTIPMLVRVGAVVLSSVMYLLLIIALAFGAYAAASIASVLTVAALLPIIFCFIGNRSPGALDNATGVAAVLIAAQRASSNVGVVITSGEELGLAGARAFASQRAAKGIALNCDTIDDRGRFIVMRSRRSERSAAAVVLGSRRLGVEVKIRRMIPGILADNIAFSESGWDSCTLSKGNLATLEAVHTSGDRNTSIDGTGIAQAADILAAAVEELS